MADTRAIVAFEVVQRFRGYVNDRHAVSNDFFISFVSMLAKIELYSIMVNIPSRSEADVKSSSRHCHKKKNRARDSVTRLGCTKSDMREPKDSVSSLRSRSRVEQESSRKGLS